MPRRRSWLGRLGILVGVGLALVGVATLVERVGGGVTLGPVVGIVELSGVIRDAEPTIEALDGMQKDSHVVAVVLRVDSPGGGVAPSQEIYEAIERVRVTKPVVASLGNVAASGGYYVAAAADSIVASPGTLTGSIGVIMEFRQLGPLAEKVGVSETIVKSGPYKDIGHPLRPLNADERTLLQGMVDDVYEQFVQAVANGRKLDATRVRTLADGRLYSGAQAKEAGLVDELGGLATAVRIAWERGGQSGDPQSRKAKPPWRPWWLDAVRTAFAPGGAGLGGGLLFLYGGPTPQ